MRIFLLLAFLLLESVWAKNVDHYVQLKVLENNLEDKISQALNSFVSLQNSVNITIKTKQVRSKKEGIQTIKNDLALPGIYDTKQEVHFDTKTKEYFVVENRIDHIIVSIDLPFSVSAKDITRAEKIAYTKGDLDKKRGDKVYVSKKAFLQKPLASNGYDANKTAQLTLQVKQLSKAIKTMQMASDKALKQLRKEYASRLAILEKENTVRKAKLDKNDIKLLAKLDKNDIKRLEALAASEKKRLDTVATQSKALMEVVRQELTQKIVDVNQTLGKKGLQSFEVLKAQLTTINNVVEKMKKQQGVTQQKVKALQTTFNSKLERILGDVNTNFTLIQAQLRTFQKELKNSELESLTNEATPMIPEVQPVDVATQEAFLRLVEQNKKAIIKVKRDASQEIAQLHTVFQKWVLMLLIAFLSLSYIIYYFSSSSKK